MRNILSELYTTNRTLSRHVQNSWFYALSIGIFCLFVLSATIIDLFFTSPNDIDYQTSFLFTSFFVVIFDGFAIILRIQSRSFIAPYQLALFPLSKWEKILFHVVLYLVDYKTLLYISVIGCFLFLFVKHSLYLAAILSMLMWLFLLIIILTWTIVLYGFIGNHLEKMERKTQYIGLFFVAILLGIQQFGDNLIIQLPVIKHTGTALYGLWINNSQLVWENLSILLGSLALPLLLLFGISRFNRNL